MTTVGSAGNSTYYGAFDMNGNVWEWNETLASGSSRGLRGGSFNALENNLRSSNRNIIDPSGENVFRGFRLASPVPGPGSVALLAIGGLGALRRRRWPRVLIISMNSSTPRGRPRGVFVREVNPALLVRSKEAGGRDTFPSSHAQVFVTIPLTIGGVACIYFLRPRGV